ncbi:DNA-binding protein [Glacieibacterium sp.]|uniref:DNA-binding protein n=1 Tax=Glacieibacterium sp. TaxID=2860237 RepID=UPI003AFF711A
MIDQVKVRVLPDDRVDRLNAALALNRSPKTLAEWRRLGIGPRAFNVGGRVFYRWSEVQAFGAGEKVAA